MTNFLKGIQLQQFAEGLITMGFDDMEVLVEVKSEDLNFLRMRGKQQDKLFEALAIFRKQNSIEDVTLEQAPHTMQAFFKTKTKMGVKE